MEDYSSNITLDPEIRFGKPCIIGPRIAVTDILEANEETPIAL